MSKNVNSGKKKSNKNNKNKIIWKITINSNTLIYLYYIILYVIIYI